jgi:hypothetical protein
VAFLAELDHTVLIFLTEVALTVLVFPTELDFTVLMFLAELDLTVLMCPAELDLTVLVIFTELDFTVLLFLTELDLTVLTELDFTVLLLLTELDFHLFVGCVPLVFMIDPSGVYLHSPVLAFSIRLGGTHSAHPLCAVTACGNRTIHSFLVLIFPTKKNSLPPPPPPSPINYRRPLPLLFLPSVHLLFLFSFRPSSFQKKKRPMLRFLKEGVR